jgi:hypothetical protein
MNADEGMCLINSQMRTLALIIKLVDFELYWLGRVPCRSVKLVGLIIAVDKYESRVRVRSEYQLPISFRSGVY